MFLSPPSSSPFPSADPIRKIVCIDVSPQVDCCITVKPNATVAVSKDKEEKSDFPFSFSSSPLLPERQPRR